MKQSKILLISIAVLALMIMAGCASNQPSPAAEGGSTSSHAQGATIINTSQEDTVINPDALSIEAAVQVGLQYIYDIFGEDVSHMYIEMEFSDWEHITRTLWFGAASENYRNTMEHRAHINQLNEMIMARLDAGEDSEDVFEDMNELFGAVRYSPARFYFFLDAITGERIDIWQTMPDRMQTVDESIPLHEHIEQEWGGDWDAAFAIEADPQIIDGLSQMAEEYAQRHFETQAIADITHDGVFASFVYSGGGYEREKYAAFVVTNDAGREARITIHVESRTVISINTMSNDFIPMDNEGMMREERR